MDSIIVRASSCAICGEGHVDGHLVAVEVGVERRADERVDLDGRALDEDRHEGLDAETVERGRAVEQHGVVLDDLFEDVPDRRLHALHDALGALDVVREALLDELAHDERLEQLERHLLRQAALVELELRPDDDDRAARVVHALAEQVLAEPALLALEHVRQALEAVVARAGDRATAAAVVDEGVARLLEHPLLVADDDLGRAELLESLEAVVPVDDAPVQVVQVGGREAAAVELDHGPEVGRDDREDGEDHPLRARAGAAERLDEAEPLDGLLPALAGRRPDLDVERPGELLEVHADDDVADGLRAHAGVEDAAAPRAGPEAGIEVAELRLQERLHRLEGVELVAEAAELVLLAVGLARRTARARRRAPRPARTRGRRSSARSPSPRRAWRAAISASMRSVSSLTTLRSFVVACLAALLAGGDDHLAGRLEDDRLLGDAGPELGDPRLDGLGRSAAMLGESPRRAARPGSAFVVASAMLSSSDLRTISAVSLSSSSCELLARLAATALHLLVDRRERAPARVLVDVRDDVEREVEDALQVPRADVEEDPEAARRPLEVPDVRHGARELDVSHPLATDLGARHLDAALVADDPLVPDALVLAAVALPVLRGTEDALVEEAVLLRLERAVVDRLRLRHLALGPFLDLVRTGERDADRAEVVDLDHRSPWRRRARPAGRWSRTTSGGPPVPSSLRKVRTSPRSRRG